MGLAARRLERLAEGGSDTALILWAELSGDPTLLSRVQDVRSPLFSLEYAALGLETGAATTNLARLGELGDLPPGLDRCRSDLLSRFESSTEIGEPAQVTPEVVSEAIDATGEAPPPSSQEHPVVEEELQNWLDRVRSWREVLRV